VHDPVKEKLFPTAGEVSLPDAHAGEAKAPTADKLAKAAIITKFFTLNPPTRF
jgi:hypothetical protein